MDTSLETKLFLIGLALIETSETMWFMCNVKVSLMSLMTLRSFISLTQGKAAAPRRKLTPLFVIVIDLIVHFLNEIATNHTRYTYII